MKFEIIELANISDADIVWKKIVDETSYSWVWSTYAQYKFRISVLQASGRLVKDKSFILLQEGKSCGLAPLLFVKGVNFKGIQASYDIPLPWPMITDSVEDYSKAEEFMLDEIELRIQEIGAKKLSFWLSPPGLGDNFMKRFRDIVRKRGFIDASYSSHYFDITPTTLEGVRKRYRRYVKKFGDNYELMVLGHDDCYSNLSNQYMARHVMDAGKVYRPIETYEAQIDLIRNKEGFMIQARNKANDKVVGMLIVSCFKKSAYDNSVAVHPDYQKEYVSHLMKWKAIQHMQQLDIDHYELGKAAISPTYFLQPDNKSYGITHFKEGWSRGCLKKALIAEKYYSKSALEADWNSKLGDLFNYFNI